MLDPFARYALVADDDPLIRMDAQTILSKAGFRVFTAAGFEDAAEILASRGHVIRLLFTDVQMPPGKMTGCDLAVGAQGSGRGLRSSSPLAQCRRKPATCHKGPCSFPSLSTKKRSEAVSASSSKSSPRWTDKAGWKRPSAERSPFRGDRQEGFERQSADLGRSAPAMQDKGVSGQTHRKPRARLPAELDQQTLARVKNL